MINIYCDESCHLEYSYKNYDMQKSMVIGGIQCDEEYKEEVTEQIKMLKEKHNMNRYNEIKWTKVAPSKFEFYKELVQYFFANENLKFRCVVFPDKSKFDYSKYDHEDIYNIMYYLLLNKMIDDENLYNIYVDKKDTRGSSKFRNLQKYLCRHHHDFNQERIRKIQIVDSSDIQLMQLADVLIGAVSYANRDLSKVIEVSKYKTQLVNLIEDLSNVELIKGTNLYENKFNVFIWNSYRR